MGRIVTCSYTCIYIYISSKGNIYGNFISTKSFDQPKVDQKRGFVISIGKKFDPFFLSGFLDTAGV